MDNKLYSVLMVSTLLLTGLAAFVTPTPGLTEGADTSEAAWPSWGYDPRNSRRTSNKVRFSNAGVRWSFDLEANLTSNIVIGPEGTIYMTSRDCELFALGPNGTVRWTYSMPDNRTLGKGQYQLAVSDGGTLYVGGETLFAFNPDSSLKWKLSLEKGTGTIQLSKEGTIYLKNTQNKLYAIDPDGTIKWSNRYNFSSSAPAIGEKAIYLGTSARKFYAINMDGTVKWNFTVAYEATSTPAISEDGTIYFTSGNFGWEPTNLYALYSNGTEKWSLKLDGDNSSALNPPALGRDGTIYLGEDFFDPENCSLTAVNPDGTIRWERAHGSYALTVPLVDGSGNIFVGSSQVKDMEEMKIETTIYAHAPSGDTLWNFTVSENTLAHNIAVGGDGTLYFGTQKGYIYALGEGEINKPSAPRNLEPELSDKKVNLTWDPPVENTDNVTEYKIYRGRSAGNMSELTTTNKTLYVDSDVSCNQTYYYKVSAFNSVGEGEKSEQVSVTVPVEEKDSNDEKDTPAPGMAIFVFILSLLVLVYDHHRKN